jgi:Zn-dependent protease with chaperone function
VVGHEIAHVANGDMVTLALIQGVVNTFVIFLSRVIGHTGRQVVFKTERGNGPAFFITMIVAEVVLGILASIIVMWFSRQREFRADAAAPAWPAAANMIAALERLNSLHPAAAAREDGGVRHRRRRRPRFQAPVHDASAAGGAYCGIARAAVSRNRRQVRVAGDVPARCLVARKRTLR